MENEEIALLIRAGRTDLYLELWTRVKGFVRARAYFRLKGTRGFDNGRACGGVEIDDLMQAGFIAMTEAVKTFSPEKNNFITWLSFYLQTAFREAQGLRTSARDPLDRCISLDRPIMEDSDETIGDAVRAPDLRESIDDSIYNGQLHDALERALNEIPERQALVIRRSFLQGKTLQEIGAEIGVTGSRVGFLRREGLRSLENNPGLRQFIDDRLDYYHGVGSQQFAHTGQSSTEALAFRRMNLEEKYLDLMRMIENEKVCFT